jgi:hypothetical protein
MVKDNVIALRPPASASPAVTAILDLDIGPAESPGLENPRNVLALDSGFLVVDAEGRSPLIFFGKRGALEKRVGASGSGPGDFSRMLAQAIDLGDQIMVPDYGNRRLVFLDAASKAWLRTVPFPSMPTVPFMWVSASPRRVASSVMEPSLTEGAHLEVVLLDRPSFEKVETITPAQTDPPSGVYPTGQVLLSGPSIGTFAIASPTLGLIEVFDDNADRVRAYQVQGDDPRAIDARDRAALAGVAGAMEQRRWDRRAQLLRDEGPAHARPRLEAMMANRPASELHVEAEYPAFIQARFDSRSGWLWIARPIRAEEVRSAPFELPWEDLRRVATRWEGYAPDGTFQRRVVVPFGTIVTDVRENRFFGVRTDSTGASRVVVLGVAAETKGPE